jgi:hypothetical protein
MQEEDVMLVRKNVLTRRSCHSASPKARCVEVKPAPSKKMTVDDITRYGTACLGDKFCPWTLTTFLHYSVNNVLSLDNFKAFYFFDCTDRPKAVYSDFKLDASFKLLNGKIFSEEFEEMVTAKFNEYASSECNADEIARVKSHAE